MRGEVPAEDHLIIVNSAHTTRNAQHSESEVLNSYFIIRNCNQMT